MLIALILELLENYLADVHDYDKVSDDHLCHMIYNTRTNDECDRVQAYSNGSHTDFGNLCCFRSTSRACRSALLRGNGRSIKSTIHRVVKPPQDQIHVSRLGLLYFSRPEDFTPMKAVPSPLLDRLGLMSEEGKDPSKPTVSGTEYVPARVKDGPL
ncbi:hypothetical protein GQ53DRAFT_831797 [Thozetella sp. PMI_491]|nr:hypothetical protein GQ53DRAFT_831797 [Thozetella sp. PMI_491]